MGEVTPQAQSRCEMWLAAVGARCGADAVFRRRCAGGGSVILCLPCACLLRTVGRLDEDELDELAEAELAFAERRVLRATRCGAGARLEDDGPCVVCEHPPCALCVEVVVDFVLAHYCCRCPFTLGDDGPTLCVTREAPLCLSCGHPPCPCCADWCEVMFTEDRDRDAGAEVSDHDFCCNGRCAYLVSPRDRHFRLDGLGGRAHAFVASALVPAPAPALTSRSAL